MNELLFCKLISNIICICWLTRINVMLNVIFTPFQVKSWLPQWFTHISLLTYIGNRGLGKLNLLLTHIGNRGFKSTKHLRFVAKRKCYFSKSLRHR